MTEERQRGYKGFPWHYLAVLANIHKKPVPLDSPRADKINKLAPMKQVGIFV